MNLNIKTPFKILSRPDRELSRSIKNLFGFYPSNIHLYRLAFLHKSRLQRNGNHTELHNNERLEYLGDAILGLIVADYLYKRFPMEDEGFLTEIRSRIVSRSHLSNLARKMGFEKMMFHDSGEKTKSKSIFGDTFEAIIGAIYLDKGYNFTKKIIVNRVIKMHLDVEEIIKTETNFKSRLIEWSQKEKKIIEYRMTNEIGEGYNKQYEVELYIDDALHATARDYSIKGAEKRVSEMTWVAIKNENDKH